MTVHTAAIRRLAYGDEDRAGDLLRSAADELDGLRAKLQEQSDKWMSDMKRCVDETLTEERAAHAETRARLESAEDALRKSHGDCGPNRCDACGHFARYGGGK